VPAGRRAVACGGATESPRTGLARRPAHEAAAALRVAQAASAEHVGLERGHPARRGGALACAEGPRVAARRHARTAIRIEAGARAAGHTGGHRRWTGAGGRGPHGSQRTLTASEDESVGIADLDTLALARAQARHRFTRHAARRLGVFTTQ